MAMLSRESVYLTIAKQMLLSHFLLGPGEEGNLLPLTTVHLPSAPKAAVQSLAIVFQVLVWDYVHKSTEISNIGKDLVEAAIVDVSASLGHLQIYLVRRALEDGEKTYEYAVFEQRIVEATDAENVNEEFMHAFVP